MMLLLSNTSYSAVYCTCRIQEGESWNNHKLILAEYDLDHVSEIGGEKKCRFECLEKIRLILANLGERTKLANKACAEKAPNNREFYFISKAGTFSTGGTDGQFGKLKRIPEVLACDEGTLITPEKKGMGFRQGDKPFCLVKVESFMECPSDYWLEKQTGECVKKVCNDGSVQGLTPWSNLGNGNGGHYEPTESGAIQFYMNSIRKCKSGYKLQEGECIKEVPAKVERMAECYF